MTVALAFLLAMLLLCVRLRSRFELVLPLGILTLMFCLGLLAMFQSMALISPLILALCAMQLIWLAADLLWKRTTGKAFLVELLRYALTPGLLLFVAMVAYYGYVSWPMTVWWRDDLAHWALSVKSLWHAGGLVDGAHLLNQRFGDYPPGVQVLQWFVMHLTGQWSEHALYFTLFLTYTVFLLPLFAKLPWRRWYLLPAGFVFLVAFPTWGNVLSYVFLGIDTTLSLCFGYVLMLVWQHRRGYRFSVVSIALGLCGLFFIKQIGLLLAGFALLLLLLRKVETWRTLLAIASAPLVLFLGWFLYCAQTGLSGYNTAGASTQLLGMLAGTYVPPENSTQILPALLYALANKYSGDITHFTAAPVPLSPAVWLLLLPLLPLAVSLGKGTFRRDMRVLSIFLAGTFLLYMGILYLSFFTTFYHETSVYTGFYKDNLVLLAERYGAPVILGGAVLLVWIVFDAFATRRLHLRNPRMLALTAVAAILLTLSTNWAVMAEVLVPERYFQGIHSVGSEDAVRDQETWGASLDEVEGARVLIDLTAASDYTKELVYGFAPAQFFLATADIAASQQALTAYLQKEGINYLVCLDENSALAQVAMPLADEYGFYGGTLYAVLWEDGNAILSEYY